MGSMVASPLRDGHGRLIGDLRISVTDRCNFRCQYCMPADGLPWLDRSELLTFEEIERGVTEDEVIPFADLARRKPYQVRFIEFMPLDADHAWSADRVLTGSEIRNMIDRVYPLEPLEREAHATAKVWRFRDGRGEIGFV